MAHDPLDDLLRSTATETRTAIVDADSGSVPPFQPNNRSGTVIAGIILLALVGFGGWFIGASPDDASELETAVDPDADVAPDVDPDADGAIDNDELEQTPEADQEPTIAPVLDLEVREQQEVGQPAFGESFVDPAFGTTVTRVTDSSLGEQIIPVQSPAAMWNADESLMLLYRTGLDSSGHIIVDAATFETVTNLAVLPTDIEHVFWHPTDPDLIVTTVDLDLVTVSVSTGAVATIASYPECDWIDPGVGTAGPSWNGELIALRCGVGSAVNVVSQPLDGSAFSILEVRSGEQGMASADGESIIIETDDGFDVYDSTLSELQAAIDWSASNPTVGIDGDGNSIIVSSGFEADFPGSIIIARLDGSADPVETIVGEDTGYPFPRSGTRTAATSWDSPGVFVAASPVPVEVQDGGPIEVFDGEVIIADTRSTPATVTRVAHTRNFAAGPFSLTLVSVSPTGRFVAYASDWLGGDTVDTYVIDLEGS